MLIRVGAGATRFTCRAFSRWSLGFASIAVLAAACGGSGAGAGTGGTPQAGSGGAGNSGGGGGPATCGPGSFGVQLAKVTVRLTKNSGGWSTAPNVQLVGSGATLGPDEHPAIWNATVDSAGLYTVSVPLGAYDVLMNAGSGLRGTLAAGVRIQQATTLSFDYQTVMVSGTVRLGGAAFPAEVGTKGSLCLVGAGSDASYFCADLPDGGGYALEVPRGGTYEMSWARSATIDSTAALSRIPYGRQVLGTRTFNAATKVDLNVDAPTFVLSGNVSWDGKPLPAAAEIWIDALIIKVASGASSSFAVRLLRGSYAPMVYFQDGSTSLPVPWAPCASGCALTADTEWRMDVSSAGPPTGLVEGTLTFSAASGGALPPPNAATMGTLILNATQLAPGAYTGFHAAPTTSSVSVDETGHFQALKVPYGTYKVRFAGSSLASAPGGIQDFDAMLVVDRERITWNQTVPLEPVQIDLTVNQQAMADDSVLDDLHEPRGMLLLYRDPDTIPFDGYWLDLGEAGPARFQRWMVPGRYRAAVETWRSLGRTHRQGYRQDVLPVGRIELDPIDILPGTGEGGLQSRNLSLGVHAASLRIEGADLAAPAVPKHTMIRLSKPNGTLLWAEVPDDGGPVELKAYSGCYDVDVFGTALAGYPALGNLDATARLGNYCTCD